MILSLLARSFPTSAIRGTPMEL